MHLDNFPKSIFLGRSMALGGTINIAFLGAMIISILQEGVMESIMPEAIERGGKLVGIFTVMDYLVAAMLAVAGG